MEAFLIFLTAICVLAILIVLLVDRSGRPETSSLEGPLLQLSERLDRIEQNLKEDFRINREEVARTATENRTELSRTLKDFTEELRNRFNELLTSSRELTTHLTGQMTIVTKTLEEKLLRLKDQVRTDQQMNREEAARSFRSFGETFDKNVDAFKVLQKEKFDALEKRQQELVQNTEKKLDVIRVTVEEKLDKTLSERLGQSFDTVGKQLMEVQKSLGEMQSIASDVGGLKKVLSNVKLRGGVGEVQLAMLLEQILAPTQYDANVRVKDGTTEAVEFAIRLPGRSEDEDQHVWLPIDAKFPKDVYEQLLHAYEHGTPEEIDAASRQLENAIRQMAKDIHSKYINPPVTTDFAIMFLPFESIYAEVIRRSGLVDQLRDQFKITVAGPTTLTALLNSLQMGFRTLALQKRSSEVWRILGAVKTEFEKFGGMLTKAQKNIQTGLGQLDDVVGTRTRAINRHLKHVQNLPAAEARNLLPEIGQDASDDGQEDGEE